ncbi:hypothetical protein [Deinococcus roseus]|uniref:hypothetical protein n=1 Tax=Deinococcus roseus TaxID=392414 RepID=UPI0016630D56|nr:hypothetical protein [Deinococcus roseus]
MTLLLMLGTAFAGDWEDLQKAMVKGRSYMPEGKVEVLVLFPPSDKPMKMRKDLPQLSYLHTLVRKNFKLSAETHQVIAGRSTTMYTLSPRNKLSNAWMVWVDDEWQVPVAYQQQDLNGTTLRRAAYQSFKGTLNPLATPFKPKVRYNADLESRILAALPGLSLPRPYRVVGFKHTQFQDVPSTEVYLSDGLNVIPVIIAPKGVQQAEGVAVISLNRQFVWVVAKLPPAELLGIIEHLKDIRTEEISNTGE